MSWDGRVRVDWSSRADMSSRGTDSGWEGSVGGGNGGDNGRWSNWSNREDGDGRADGF